MFGLRLIKIAGHSMEPALPAGSFVLVWEHAKRHAVGDIVLFQPPSDGIMVKRIRKIIEPNYYVYGDNQLDSYDSKDFGPIQRSQLLGKVVWH